MAGNVAGNRDKGVVECMCVVYNKNNSQSVDIIIRLIETRAMTTTTVHGNGFNFTPSQFGSVLLELYGRKRIRDGGKMMEMKIIDHNSCKMWHAKCKWQTRFFDYGVCERAGQRGIGVVGDSLL